jgi:hypothetical protein
LVLRFFNTHTLLNSHLYNQENAMIGIQEIIDLSARLHGGNRLADHISQAKAHCPTTDRSGWNNAALRAIAPRKGGKLIAMPIIADELSHFTPSNRHNQAA